jgi:NTP pyrophosphatase (non-canonical NTP hydrolase)
MSDSIDLQSFQQMIHRTFGQKDADRGLAGTFVWFVEEVGELARALKRLEPDKANLEEEFSDVLAWLTTLASLSGIDLQAAARRYMKGCPRCDAAPCTCDEFSRFGERVTAGPP